LRTRRAFAATWWDSLIGGLLSEPLPFGSDLQPKPVAFAIDDTLRDHQR